jgi:hypothetical protein
MADLSRREQIRAFSERDQTRMCASTPHEFGCAIAPHPGRTDSEPKIAIAAREEDAILREHTRWRGLR